MFLNRQGMVTILQTLIAMDHPQKDNDNTLNYDRKTGVGIVRSIMNPKRSKYWDMRYQWIEDYTKMGLLNPYW